MIVAVEAVGAKHGGAARIALGAAVALAEHDAIDEVVVFASGGDVRAFEFPDRPDVRVVQQPGAEDPKGRLVWLNHGLGAATDAAGADVVLALNAMGAVSGVPLVNYYQQPLLYDEDARKLLDGDTRTRLTAIRSLTWRAAKEARRHVVQTEWMRARVSEAWAIPPELIDVATPAPPDWERSTGSRGEDLLWIGHRLGYKRWPLAQWIHQRWRSVSPDARLRTTLDEASGDGIEALGSQPWDAMEAQYRDVGALLVTSMTESLGLPLLEALATGCPIVAPDLAWVRTVCDNAALYWPSDSPEEAIERLRDLQQPGVSKDLRDRMERRCQEIRAAQGWRRLADSVVNAV